MVIIIFVLVIFFSTGCSDPASTEPPTYSLQEFIVDDTSVLSNLFEYKNDVSIPTGNVEAASSSVSSSSNGNPLYSLTINLSDLGINSTNTIDLAVEIVED